MVGARRNFPLSSTDLDLVGAADRAKGTLDSSSDTTTPSSDDTDTNDCPLFKEPYNIVRPNQAVQLDAHYCALASKLLPCWHC